VEAASLTRHLSAVLVRRGLKKRKDAHKTKGRTAKKVRRRRRAGRQSEKTLKGCAHKGQRAPRLSLQIDGQNEKCKTWKELTPTEGDKNLWKNLVG